MGVKITGTAYWEVAKGGKYETGTTKTYVAASDQRIVDSIIELSTGVYRTIGRLDEKCTTINQAAVDLTQTVANLQQNAGSLTQQLGALDTRVAGNHRETATGFDLIADAFIKVNAAIISLG
jgi:hypothetical protein